MDIFNTTIKVDAGVRADIKRKNIIEALSIACVPKTLSEKERERL